MPSRPRGPAPHAGAPRPRGEPHRAGGLRAGRGGAHPGALSSFGRPSYRRVSIRRNGILFRPLTPPTPKWQPDPCKVSRGRLGASFDPPGDQRPLRATPRPRSVGSWRRAPPSSAWTSATTRRAPPLDHPASSDRGRRGTHGPEFSECFPMGPSGSFPVRNHNLGGAPPKGNLVRRWPGLGI